jgi:hypothetical protein
MPSPPKDSGVVTSSHATKQWPPCTSRRPFQTKARQTLVKASSVSGGTSRDIRACTIIAERVDWTRIVLPPRFMSLAHHGCSLLVELSTTGWSWAAVTLRMLRGKPRYLQGREAISQPKIPLAAATCSGEHRMGCKEHLARLVRKPEPTPKTQLWTRKCEGPARWAGER